MPPAAAFAPETVEGWFVLHQVVALDECAARRLRDDERAAMAAGWAAVMRAESSPAGGGWSAVAPLIGSTADLLMVHLRPSLDAIGVVQHRLRREPFSELLRPVHAQLGVTEAPLYHVTAELLRGVAERGGQAWDAAHLEARDARLRTERDSPAVQRRVHPPYPPEMPYISFASASRRRANGENWYALPLEERVRLLHAHGLTLRRHGQRVQQLVTASTGLDAWEMGVTQFARDPVDFKRLAAETRFDALHARFTEMGPTFVGKVVDAGDWAAALG